MGKTFSKLQYLGILAHILRMVMEPKNYAFRRWLDTPSSSFFGSQGVAFFRVFHTTSDIRLVFFELSLSPMASSLCAKSPSSPQKLGKNEGWAVKIRMRSWWGFLFRDSLNGISYLVGANHPPPYCSWKLVMYKRKWGKWSSVAHLLITNYNPVFVEYQLGSLVYLSISTTKT